MASENQESTPDRSENAEAPGAVTAAEAAAASGEDVPVIEGLGAMPGTELDRIETEEAASLSAVGVGAKAPLRVEHTEQDSAFNRSVSFRVIMIDDLNP